MIKKEKIYEGTTQDKYKVTLLNDEWPDDETLIDWCDLDNMGGLVGPKGINSCVVTVYKD
jgi:hypothetical protein